MKEDILVSIITPSFNQGEYIEDTIKSVLNQTYKNIEYIVMDGGSTDSTLKVLEKYKDRIKFVSEKDHGQADAINKGFKSAKGDIVGWINSDDMLEENCVELIVNEFSKNSKTGIVYGNFINIDKNNVHLNLYKDDKVSLFRLLNVDSAVVQPGSFYRRDLVQKVGFLDDSLRYVMDYDLWVKLLKISDIKYIDKVLAYFRLHGQSKTVSEEDGFAPEIEKVIQRNGGSVYALPVKYLKKNYYDKWFSRVQDLVKSAFKDVKNVGVYGTGMHTKSLLEVCDATYGLKNFNIFVFDSNKDKRGTNFEGYTIYSPDKINELGITKVIISSFSYQEEIYDFIKDICNKDIEIVKLYDKDKNCTFFM